MPSFGIYRRVIAFALKMQAMRSTEMSVLTRIARLHIPEDGIAQSLP
jgi:hypothetical protein